MISLSKVAYTTTFTMAVYRRPFWLQCSGPSFAKGIELRTAPVAILLAVKFGCAAALFAGTSLFAPSNLFPSPAEVCCAEAIIGSKQWSNLNAGQSGVDRYGDPLPKGAVARLGTVRLRNCGALLFSRDGKQLITAGGDALTDVVFWDLKTGKETRRLTDGGFTINRLHLSPDGSTLVATAGGSTPFAPVWDTVTGKKRFTFWCESGLCQFTDDSKTVVTVGPNSRENPRAIIKWNAVTGQEISAKVLPPQAPGSIGWLGGNVAAIETKDSVGFFDIENMVEKQRIAVSGRLSFSPEGQHMAEATIQGVQLWNIANGKKEWACEQLAGSSVVFSSDGKQLAWTSSDDYGNHSLWIYAKGDGQPRQFRQFDPGFGHMAFSPNGLTLAHTTSAGVVELRDVKTGGAALPVFDGHMGRVYKLKLLPDGHHLATFDSDCLLIWDLATKSLVRRFPQDLPAGEIALPLTTAAGKVVTARPSDGSLRVRDLVTGMEARKLAAPRDFAGDFMHIATVTESGRFAAILGRTAIGVFDLSSGDCVVQHAHKLPVWDLQLSGDGKLLQVRLQHPKNGLVEVCVSAQTGKEVAPERWLTVARSSGASRWRDESTWLRQLQELRLKNTQGNEEFANFGGRLDRVIESPGSRFLAVCYSDQLASSGKRQEPGVTRVWECSTGTLLEHINLSKDRTLRSFSSDERQLIATSYSDVHLVDIATGRERMHLKGNIVGWINSLLVTPDLRFLISGGDDSQVLIWDLTVRSPDGIWRTVKHEPKKQLEWWDKLASLDGVEAHKAVWELAADPDGTVAFLATKLQPIAVPDDKTCAQLLADLGSESFAKRQQAQSRLIKIGDPVVPAMRDLLTKTADLEQRLRLKKLIEDLGSNYMAGDRLRAFRGLEILERIGSTRARALLKTLSDGAASARFTRTAKESLERLELN
jgi:WD40 repeat protein